MEEKDRYNISFIIRYFDLELSENEMIEFDKRLQNDSSFASKVEKYYDSINLVNQSYKNLEQEKQIEKWKQLISKKPTSSISHHTWKLIGGIVASFLILISGWYFISNSQSTDYTILAQKAWNKKVGFENYQVRNGITSVSKKQIIMAFKAFENKEYNTALKNIQHLNSSSIYYEEVLLMRALCLHKTNHTENALATLDSLYKLPSGRLYRESQWYKGLLFLDQKNLKSASNYLEIPTNQNDEIRLKKSSN